MDEEKEKKEIDKRVEQVPAKSIDELMEPVERIPDEVFATKEGGIIIKALYKEQSSKNRQLEEKISILEEQNKELEKKLVVYEEQLSSKRFMDFVASLLVAISLFLIQMGFQLNLIFLNWIGIVLIVIAIIIILGPFRLPVQFRGRGEKK